MALPKVLVTGTDEDQSSMTGSVNPMFDGDRWDLSNRNMDSTISLSQYSLATTNTADASIFDPLKSVDNISIMSAPSTTDDLNNTTESSEQGVGYYGSTLINENHANYVLMYDMLTGIRIAVHENATTI